MSRTFNYLKKLHATVLMLEYKYGVFIALLANVEKETLSYRLTITTLVRSRLNYLPAKATVFVFFLCSFKLTQNADKC